MDQTSDEETSLGDTHCIVTIGQQWVIEELLADQVYLVHAPHEDTVSVVHLGVRSNRHIEYVDIR